MIRWRVLYYVVCLAVWSIPREKIAGQNEKGAWMLTG